MPFDIGGFGQGVAGQLFGAGMGLLLEGHNDRRQRRQQEELQKLQIAGQKEMTDYNYAKQLQMWHDTNYSAQVAELEKAGLNPGLIYGMKGGGGVTTGSGGGSVQGATAPSGGGEAIAGAQMGIQLQLLNAQKELINAQRNKTNAEAEKISGPDTENIKADTANKILQQVINDFAGKEAKEMYERVNHPNRAIQSKTLQDELEARQGIAGTIYELWLEGKLYDKSVAEIENILLSNEKTKGQTRQIIKSMDLLEENIKGAKLDNVIKELESKLQTATGIDKNSPYWLKILGRLFVGLFNK